MITISVNIQGQEKVEQGFAEIERGISSLRPLWEKLGEEFRSDEVALFDKQPWTPLAPATLKQKEARGFGGKGILRAEDNLFRSLTERGATGNISRVFDLSAEFGTSDAKAMLHKLGTRRMPARDPMVEPDVDKYATLAGEYLAEVVRNAGFN